MPHKILFLIILIFLHASYCLNGKDEVNKNAIQEDEYYNSKDNTDIMRTNQVEMTAHVHNHRRHHKDPVETPSSRLKLFEQTDTDGDGFVTRKEYVLHNGLTDNATDTDDLFATYDRDNDGQLSEQEFVDQSSPWEVIDECEFQVMQKCNAELDQSMNEADTDLDEPLCRGLQSYLDCVMGGKQTDKNCDIEGYISSVKQTALVYRSSGLCPNLEIGKFDFEIEIDYEPKDEIIDESYDDLTDSEFSSDSTSSRGRPARSLSDADDDDDDAPSEEQQNGLDNSVARECSSNLLVSCGTEFESRISNDMETKSSLEEYRECVLQNTRYCDNERQSLLVREGLKIIAKKHRAIFQNEFTKDASQRPPN